MTKKQRHLIYKKALEMISADYWDSGLCTAFDTIKPSLMSGYPNFGKIIELHFPEAQLFCPDFYDGVGGWFEFGDNFPRQIILDFCIEMTK